MFKNYLAIAIRNLFRHRGFSLINIAGLSIGIAVSLLLLLWLQYHVLFDRQHEKIDRIARLLINFNQNGNESIGSSTPYAILPNLVREYPQIDEGTRLRNISEVLVDTGENRFANSYITLTEPGFFRIFDVPVVEGDPEQALDDVHSAVLPERTARTLFGEENAIGKTFHVQFEERAQEPYDSMNEFILNQSAVKLMELENPVGENIRQHRFNGTVIGVVQDFENNYPIGGVQPMVLWRSALFTQSILVGFDPGNSMVCIEIIRSEFERLFPDIPFQYRFLSDMIDSSYGQSRYIKNVVGWFALISILLSFIGLYGLNVFITEQRTREIGIRKVIGATTGEISWQLLRDFLVLIVIGALPAMPTAWYFSQKFIEMFYYRIPIEWHHFTFPLLLVLVFAIGTMLYRTMQVSRIKPSEMLRSE